MAQNRFCTQCGLSLEPEDRFCTECGASCADDDKVAGPYDASARPSESANPVEAPSPVEEPEAMVVEPEPDKKSVSKPKTASSRSGSKSAAKPKAKPEKARSTAASKPKAARGSASRAASGSDSKGSAVYGTRDGVPVLRYPSSNFGGKYAASAVPEQPTSSTPEDSESGKVSNGLRKGPLVLIIALVIVIIALTIAAVVSIWSPKPSVADTAVSVVQQQTESSGGMVQKTPTTSEWPARTGDVQVWPSMR